MKTYGFVGLGLMGGSLAKAVRRPGFNAGNSQNGALSASKILACDINRTVLEQAVSEGLIDQGYTPDKTDEMLAVCDIVFVCLYPNSTTRFLIQHQYAFKSGSVVTDISGVKKSLEKNVSVFTRKDVFFVSGHPMAGSEKEGYGHSSADICDGRNYILIKNTETDEQSVAVLTEIIKAMGFKSVVCTDGKTHDHKIAFTSQLCHIIASALVDCAEDTGITAFGGGSYEDLTRIAMINAPLWTQLFLENREDLLKHIQCFEKSLETLTRLLKDKEADRLCSALENIRQKRIAMSTSNIV